MGRSVKMAMFGYGEGIGWEELNLVLHSTARSIELYRLECGRCVDVRLVSLARGRMLIGYEHHVMPGGNAWSIATSIYMWDVA
jgi:hypothetical protein